MAKLLFLSYADNIVKLNLLIERLNSFKIYIKIILLFVIITTAKMNNFISQ